MNQPFPLVELSGSPTRRGDAYGRAVSDRISKSVSLYLESLSRYGLSESRREELLQFMLSRIGDFDPAYVEEMEGIAKGAGVDLLDVALVNCRTEMLQLARDGDRLTDPDGCTGLVVLPDAAAEGALIHAQNWDWRAECAETCVVLLIRRDDAPDILTFTEAGALARAGVNEAGIAVTANYLESDRDYRRLGVPLPLIRRKILEQEHYAHALRAASCTPKSASNNMIVSTREGFAVDIECAPDESFHLVPENGLLVHANHWRSPVALAKLRETGIESTPDSLYRDFRVQTLLEPKLGSVTVHDVKQVLLDDLGSPYSVCQPPHASPGGIEYGTVATIVIRPQDFVMEIAPLPATGAHFSQYSSNGGIQHVV